MSVFVRSFTKRKKFLDALEVGDSPSKAARKAGGTLQNFKSWRDADENFKRDWEEAEEEGTQFLEDAATERAIDKSDPLMMFMLKARKPEKYDRGGKLELSGNINVEGSKQKLLNKIAKLQAQKQISSEAGRENAQEREEESQEVKALPAPGQHFQPQPAVVRGSKRRRKVASAGREGPEA